MASCICSLSGEAEFILEPDCLYPIDLQVGEVCFLVSPKTLSQSGFFNSYFDGNQELNNEVVRLGKFKYFLDADPDMFLYVLRYLRRGSVPQYFGRSERERLAFQIALRDEARYYDIQRLVELLDARIEMQI